jgi:hypothetical protein
MEDEALARKFLVVLKLFFLMFFLGNDTVAWKGCVDLSSWGCVVMVTCRRVCLMLCLLHIVCPRMDRRAARPRRPNKESWRNLRPPQRWKNQLARSERQQMCGSAAIKERCIFFWADFIFASLILKQYKPKTEAVCPLKPCNLVIF